MDRRGTPLAAGLTGANRNDHLFLAPLLDVGPSARRPATLHVGKGDDDPACRDACIAHRGVEDKRRLGQYRLVGKRTLAWLARYRRLSIRNERHEVPHQAFRDLGCALLYLNAPERF